MNRTPQSRRFFRIAGPILLYWLIQYVAQVLALMFLTIMHVPELFGSLPADAATTPEGSVELATELLTRMLELAARYQSGILIFTALCTVPLTAALFIRDRKMEKTIEKTMEKTMGIYHTGKAPAWNYLKLLLFGGAFCLGGNALLAMSGLAMRNASYLKYTEAVYSDGILMLFLCHGLIVPVAEELMFRGVLYKRCREQMRFFGAAFSVSCLFAFTHSTVAQLAYTLILGIFLAYVYEKFGSLKAPVFLHILVNTVSIAATKTGFLNWVCSSVGRMAVCIVGCTFAAAVSFVWMQQIKTEPDTAAEKE